MTFKAETIVCKAPVKVADGVEPFFTCKTSSQVVFTGDEAQGDIFIFRCPRCKTYIHRDGSPAGKQYPRHEQRPGHFDESTQTFYEPHGFFDDVDTDHGADDPIDEGPIKVTDLSIKH